MIELGDMAKDTITGYKGIVIARTEWIAGCDRLTLQAQGLKDGKPHEAQSFDVTHCELVKQNVIARQPPTEAARPVKGGPRPAPTRWR